MQHIIVIDTETGGKDAARHALLGIGAVELLLLDGEWRAMRSFETLVLPHAGLAVDGEAAILNGYDPEDWEARFAVPEERAAVLLAEFIAGTCNAVFGKPRGRWVMGGHNVRFDRDFLEAFATRTGMVFTPHHVPADLMVWARLAYAQSAAAGVDCNGGYSLDAVAQFLGLVPEAKPHRPLAGAMLAALGIIKVLERMGAGKNRLF